MIKKLFFSLFICIPLFGSSIHHDVELGNIQKVQDWLASGNDVHEKDNLGWTPLHYAANVGNLRVVKMLLSYGADLNEKSKTPEDSAYRDFGDTPLMAAATAGQTEMVEYLLQAGAKINATDCLGTAPLHIAAQGPKIEMLRILLDHGADINCSDLRGETPLLQAKENLAFLELLVERGADINVCDTQGLTLLMHAAGNQTTDLTLFLLNHGADATLLDGGGRTALHYAADSGQIETAKHLLQKGANLNHNAYGGCGLLSFCGTPLMCAARAGHENMVLFLLQRGAKLHQQEELLGETALDFALNYGHPKIAELLIKKGALPSDLMFKGKPISDESMGRLILNELQPYDCLREASQIHLAEEKKYLNEGDLFEWSYIGKLPHGDQLVWGYYWPNDAMGKFSGFMILRRTEDCLKVIDVITGGMRHASMISGQCRLQGSHLTYERFMTRACFFNEMLATFPELQALAKNKSREELWMGEAGSFGVGNFDVDISPIGRFEKQRLTSFSSGNPQETDQISAQQFEEEFKKISPSSLSMGQSLMLLCARNESRGLYTLSLAQLKEMMNDVIKYAQNDGHP